MPPLLFWGFWDSPRGNAVDNTQRDQLRMWAASILACHPGAAVRLWTRRSVVPPGTLDVPGLEVLYLEGGAEELFRGTPLESFRPDPGLPKAELSDLIRLALLFRHGGTWIDTDDITVRPQPAAANTLGTFLWPGAPARASYWGSAFDLAPGALVAPPGRWGDFSFHVQNDPMTRWDAGHPFLRLWMERAPGTPSRDWGQRLPTDLLREDPARAPAGAGAAAPPAAPPRLRPQPPVPSPTARARCPVRPRRPRRRPSTTTR